MPARQRRGILVGGWIVSLSILISGSTGQAQQNASAATQTPAQTSQRVLQAAVERLAEKLEPLFDDEWERPPRAARTPRAIQATVADVRVGRAISSARLDARGRAWVSLGLGSARSPRVLYERLARDLDGVALDGDEARLLVAEDRYAVEGSAFDEETSRVMLMTGVHPDEPLLAHYLAHLRQLERDGDWLEPTTDGLLAAAAWAEGEANLLALRLLFEGMGLADTVLEASANPGDFLDGRLVPRGLSRLGATEREMLRFVYDEGFAVANAAFRRGGWDAVSDGISRPRLTTNLLHLDGAPRQPVQIELATEPWEGLAAVDVDSLGEQGIATLLSLQSGKLDSALAASVGWLHDDVTRWEGQGSSGLTQWRTAWRDTRARDDFVYAWTSVLERRFPQASRQERADQIRFVGAVPEAWLRVGPTSVETWIGESSELQRLTEFRIDADAGE